SIREFDFRFDQIRGKMKFSLHAYAFNMSTAFLLYFDKLIILPLFGYAVLGYYQISLQFLLFVGMIPISLYQYLLSSESADTEKTKLRVLGYGVSVILALLLFVASPWLIQKFFPNFENSIDALRIVSIGIMPMTMVWTINSRLFKIGKSKFVAIGSAIYLSVQITLIYLLGHALGVMGLAIALDIALTVQAAFLYFYQKRTKRDLLQ
ncbi:MAG: polysaccharide biosynthesis C-terminal domain-containing protein, partial [Nitrosopumilus sp.]|nr:polysaccharide biosynthesis C-terminal domain-containing protein [Nitrosopumilus sp.]